MRDESYFSQFNDQVDEEFNNAVLEAEKENGDKGFEKLPDGKYEVKITDMVIKKNKNDEWMLQITFKVVAGKLKNRLHWAFYTLKPQTVHFANVFLRALESGIEVKYESERQYAKLIDNIFTEINGYKEYGIELKTNDKGFTNTKVIKVFKVEPEELPFS